MRKARIGIFGMVPISLLQDCTLHELKAYAALASFQGSNDSAWPSLEQIGERANMHPHNVSKAIKKLSQKGWVQVDRRGKKLTNSYAVAHEIIADDLAESAGSDLVESCSELAESTKCDSVESTNSIRKEQVKEQVKEQAASPPLSLESESDTKTNVATVRAKFLELAGKGGRWGAKQTKIAQSLLKDFPPDHVCENMKLLKEECIAKRGQYGWAFSMEKLTWKWEDIETIKEAEDADLMSEMKRLFPGWVPKSERTA